VAKAKIDPKEIEDVIVGCAMPEGEQGLNVARLIGFLAHLPINVAGTTVNRFCGSSMQAIHMAAGAIQLDAGEAFVCAGVESMTRVPMTGFNPMPHPGLAKEYPQAYISMGQTAENVARKYQVTRADQQALAVASHKKAAAAQAAGKLKDEIVSIKAKDGTVDQDGCIRADTTQETLSGLQPAFDAQGSVTAGTSSPLTDGAAAVLVCTEDYAKRNKLPVLAKLRSIAVAGCAPEVMGLGPVPAAQKALKRAGLAIKDIDVVEINEAFASQAIACMRELGIDEGKANLDGGAIALGHPLGATGARITGKAASLLKREGKRYALATQCIGGGQGIATILESA
jgi:acetyl-CoA acyltransferase